MLSDYDIQGQKWLQKMKARFEKNFNTSDDGSMVSAQANQKAAKQQFTIEHVAEIL